MVVLKLYNNDIYIYVYIINTYIFISAKRVSVFFFFFFLYPVKESSIVYIFLLSIFLRESNML